MAAWAGESAANAQPADSKEAEAWAAAKRAGTEAAYIHYLESFSSGEHADEARGKLQEFQKPNQSGREDVPSRSRGGEPPSSPEPGTSESATPEPQLGTSGGTGPASPTPSASPPNASHDEESNKTPAPPEPEFSPNSGSQPIYRAPIEPEQNPKDDEPRTNWPTEEEPPEPRTAPGFTWNYDGRAGVLTVNAHGQTRTCKVVNASDYSGLGAYRVGDETRVNFDRRNNSGARASYDVTLDEFCEMATSAEVPSAPPTFASPAVAAQPPVVAAVARAVQAEPSLDGRYRWSVGTLL